MPSASCGRKIAAFQDCAKKHPRNNEIVCRHLEAGAAWCMIAQVCPQEVEDLENCAGGVSSAQMSAGRVPKRCLPKLDALDACIEQHQHSTKPD